MSSVLLKDTLPQIVLQWAKNQPDKAAVASGDSSVTYYELQDMVNACAYQIKQLGAERGDAIVISAVMKAEYIAAFLAVKSLRMIAVPVNKTASEAEVKEIIGRLDAKIFLTDNPRYSQIGQCMSLQESSHGTEKLPMEEAAKEYIPGDEITEILFTSGTTGRPKGAMLSQKGIIASIKNTADGMEMQNTDTILIPLPLNHSFGLRVLRSALSKGGTIVLTNGFSFAKELKTNLEKWNCNCMAVVNAGFEMLKQQMGESYKECFGKLRYIEFGAGAVTPKTRQELIDALPRVRLYNTWGSTETGGGLFLEFSSNFTKIDSAGTTINDIEIAVFDADGEVVTDDGYGRLGLKSEASMSGYYADEELTQASFHEEWLLTNDVARIDKDGYVYLNGRVDDLISVGGEKVAPADIERIIESHEGIKECACCGVDDPQGVLGQVPIVFIVGNFEEKQLEEKIRTLGNGYMVPFAYIKLEEIPRNYMGKTDRKALKDIWNNRMGSHEEGNADFAQKVLNLITTRRSVRVFEERSIRKELLEQILLAGRMAPSGHNMQTWRFTVLQTKENIEHLKDIAAKTAAKKKTLFYGFNNPQAIIIVSNDRRNADGIQDASAAIENILLMAHALELGACWINALLRISDEGDIRELLDAFGIPKTHLVYGMVGLGYPQNEPKVPVKKEDVIKFID